MKKVAPPLPPDWDAVEQLEKSLPPVALQRIESAVGRIVEAYASGPVSRDQVLRFYAATLPQLGWRADGDAAFRREDEILKLEFPPPGPGGLTVLFTLAPAR